MQETESNFTIFDTINDNITAFSNIFSIFSKISEEGSVGVMVDTFQNIIDKEIVYAVKGLLTRAS
jgi:hypothetical protein